MPELTIKYKLSITTNADRNIVYKPLFAYVFGIVWENPTALLTSLTNLAHSEIGKTFLDEKINNLIDINYNNIGEKILDKVETSKNKTINIIINGDIEFKHLNHIYRRINNFPKILSELAPKAAVNLKIEEIKFYKIKIYEEEIEKSI